MKKIVLIPNPVKDTDFKVTKEIVSKLTELDFTVYVDHLLKDKIGINVLGYDDFPTDADFLIVVGGDGSVIDASRYAVSFDVPLLGVNLGKVGYLTEVDPDNLELLARLKSGKYKLEEKMLLEVSVKDGENIITSDRLAVNDVVISHSQFLGICNFEIENEDGDSIKYRADGVIASTPVGSTAYSFSAGGPVVSHNVDTILLTPVSAHSFFNRSILFNGAETLKITNINDADLNISIDGRFYSTLKKGASCKIKQSQKRIKTVHFASADMFSTLFKKMKILEDI